MSEQDKQQLEEKTPEEQREILRARLHPRYTPLQIKEKYVVTAAKTVIPGFIQALMSEATPEQRHKAQVLLKSVSASAR